MYQDEVSWRSLALSNTQSILNLGMELSKLKILRNLQTPVPELNWSLNEQSLHVSNRSNAN